MRSEPLPRVSRTAYFHSELPYGLWTCEDGREVLFNRHYQPILERFNRGMAMFTNRREWVTFTSQRWFYDDSSERRASTKKKLEQVLAAFQSGRDVIEWLQS